MLKCPLCQQGLAGQAELLVHYKAVHHNQQKMKKEFNLQDEGLKPLSRKLKKPLRNLPARESVEQSKSRKRPRTEAERDILETRAKRPRDGPMPCPFCEKSFQSSLLLIHHFATNHEDKMPVMKLLKVEADPETGHEATHAISEAEEAPKSILNTPKKICTFCSQVLSGPWDTHIIEEHNQGDQKSCVRCQKPTHYSSKDNLVAHLLKMHAAQYKASPEADLVMKAVGIQKKSYSCAFCKLEMQCFPGNHLIEKHNEGDTERCRLCKAPKRFSSKGNLVIHLTNIHAKRGSLHTDEVIELEKEETSDGDKDEAIEDDDIIEVRIEEANDEIVEDDNIIEEHDINEDDDIIEVDNNEDHYEVKKEDEIIVVGEVNTEDNYDQEVPNEVQNARPQKQGLTSSKKVYTCAFCSMEMTCFPSGHILAEHNKGNSSHCLLCENPRVFSTKGNLVLHLVKRHAQEAQVSKKDAPGVQGDAVLCDQEKQYKNEAAYVPADMASAFVQVMLNEEDSATEENSSPASRKSGNRGSTCPLCSAQVQGEPLGTHIILEHNQGNPRQCRVCQSSRDFSTRGNLVSHLMKQHRAAKAAKINKQEPLEEPAQEIFEAETESEQVQDDQDHIKLEDPAPARGRHCDQKGVPLCHVWAAVAGLPWQSHHLGAQQR